MTPVFVAAITVILFSADVAVSFHQHVTIFHPQRAARNPFFATTTKQKGVKVSPEPLESSIAQMSLPLSKSYIKSITIDGNIPPLQALRTSSSPIKMSFSDTFTTLTGETGAGKSVLFDLGVLGVTAEPLNEYFTGGTGGEIFVEIIAVISTVDGEITIKRTVTADFTKQRKNSKKIRTIESCSIGGVSLTLDQMRVSLDSQKPPSATLTYLPLPSLLLLCVGQNEPFDIPCHNCYHYKEIHPA